MDSVIEVVEGKEYIRLYYFMPAQHFLEVIEKDLLKVSIPEQCNDPLEFMPSGANVYDEHGREDGAFISFTRRFDNSIMWAHYADSHRGVCLEFFFPVVKRGDVEAASFAPSLKDKSCHFPTQYAILEIGTEYEDQFVTLDGRHHYALVLKVVYSDNRPKPGIGFSGMYKDGLLERPAVSGEFYTKSKDWEYEKEWRLFVNLPGTQVYENGCFFVRGLTKFLSGVILGVKYPESQYVTWGKIQQAIKRNKLFLSCDGTQEHSLELHRAVYAKSTYQIERQP